jgi:hypothetical protein
MCRVGHCMIPVNLDGFFAPGASSPHDKHAHGCTFMRSTVYNVRRVRQEAESRNPVSRTLQCNAGAGHAATTRHYSRKASVKYSTWPFPSRLQKHLPSSVPSFEGPQAASFPPTDGTHCSYAVRAADPVSGASPASTSRVFSLAATNADRWGPGASCGRPWSILHWQHCGSSFL